MFEDWYAPAHSVSENINNFACPSGVLSFNSDSIVCSIEFV